MPPEIHAGLYGSTPGLNVGGLRMLHGMAAAGDPNSPAFQAALQAFKDGILHELGHRTTSQIWFLKIYNVTCVATHITRSSRH